MGTAQIASAPSTGGKIFYKMLHLLLLLSASSLAKASYGPALGLGPDIGPRYGYGGHPVGKREAEPSYGAIGGHTTGPQCHANTERQCQQRPVENARQIPRQACHPVPRQVCVPTARQVCV